MSEAGTVSAAACFLPLTIGRSKMAQQILPESISGIYEILNTVTDKRYVGSAQNFLKRWKEHLKGLNSGKHHSKHLQRAWDKYGAEAFVFQAVLYCEPAELIEYEQLCMDEMNSAYNICRVAGSTRGRVHTLECRQKISAKALGRVWSEEARAKVSATLKGRKMSESFCAQLRGNQYAKGTKHTEEWKAANSLRHTGVPRPKSEEHRRKISEGLKGKKLSEECKAKISAATKGRKRGPYTPMSEETKAAMLEKRRANPRKPSSRIYTEEDRKKLSEQAKLAKHTPEAKAKRSAAMKTYWSDPGYRAKVLAARAEAKRMKAKLAS